MNNVLVLIIFIGVFAIVIGVIVGSFIHRRELVFEGEVIDKNIVETQSTPMQQPGQPGSVAIGNVGGIEHTYKIKVQTDQGKKVNYTISSGMYETIKIGDRVSKPKGTTDITIVNSPQPPSNPTPPASPPPPQPPTVIS